MDSMAITKELEKRHPSPSLHLDSPYQQRALEALGKVFEGTRGIWMPKVPNNLLNPKSAEYFQRTRSQAVGMPLAQYQAEKGGETAWKNSEEAIKSMAALLKENDGPFLMGDELSYGDFILASAIHFLGRIDKSDGERLVGMDPALGRLMDATKKYFEKSD